MKRFSRFLQNWESSDSLHEKAQLLKRTLLAASEADAAWALFWLASGKIKTELRASDWQAWGRAQSGLPDWLWEECHAAAGDWAEVVAWTGTPASPPENATLELNFSAESTPPPATDAQLSEWMEWAILPLAHLSDAQKKDRVLQAWSNLAGPERRVLNRLLSGSLRRGQPDEAVFEGIERAWGVPAPVVAARLSRTRAGGDPFSPTDWLRGLIAPRIPNEPGWECARRFSQLKPLLIDDPSGLGPLPSWQADWLASGERAWIELGTAADFLVWSEASAPRAIECNEATSWLKTLPQGTLLEAQYLEGGQGDLRILDVRVFSGEDLSHLPLNERLEKLSAFSAPPKTLQISSPLHAGSWEETREILHAGPPPLYRGILLRPRDGSSVTWEWKASSRRVRALLLYAHSQGGPSEFTFAVAQESKWVGLVKTREGLSSKAWDALDSWCRENTVERFGPTRQVSPERFFELSLQSVTRNSRTKSGVSVIGARVEREVLGVTLETATPLSEVQSWLGVGKDDGRS